jgi:hypothetical protein
MAALAADAAGEIDIHAPDPAPGLLLLPWRKFPLDYEGGGFTVKGVPLRVKEVANSGLGTGAWRALSVAPDTASDAHLPPAPLPPVFALGSGLTLWDGAPALAKALELAAPDLSRATVLEVGAGTGLVGIAAAALGARRVVLTDLPYALNNTREVVALNVGGAIPAGTEVTVAELDW